jgi:hypothetical protein
MFEKISKRAQFLLLAMFLEEQTVGNFNDELKELLNSNYVDFDYNITKKGEAFVHMKNKVGVNFKEMLSKNSKKANYSLVNEAIKWVKEQHGGLIYLKEQINKQESQSTNIEQGVEDLELELAA